MKCRENQTIFGACVEKHNSLTIFPQHKGPFYFHNNFCCMTKIPIRNQLIETVETVDHSGCKIAEQMKV